MGTRQLSAYAGKLSGGTTAPFQSAGAPTSDAGGTYAGRASVGSLLIDTTNGKLYVATAATSSSVTWAVVGTQT